MISLRSCIAIAAIALFAAGCQKKVQPVRPAPVVLPKAEPKQEPPPPLPAAPKIQGQARTPAPPVAVEVKPPPPAKPVVTKKSGRTPPSKKGDIKAEVRPPEVKIEPRPEAAGAKPEPETPPQPIGPAIGEILTPEQVRDYTRRLDGALDRSKSALIIIESKTLDAAQKQTAARVRGFITQAEQGRAQDIATAASLAERADVLSKDLLSRLR